MSSQYLASTLEASIAAANGQFPALVLSGPRQVGRTDLLKHLCAQINANQPKRRYVTLDSPMLLALARDEPA